MPRKKSRRPRASDARAAQKALRQLQEDAKTKGLDKLTDSQIDDIIDDSRRQMKARKEKPMKRAPKKAPKRKKAP